jgi:hypothetical protein
VAIVAANGCSPQINQHVPDRLAVPPDKTPFQKEFFWGGQKSRFFKKRKTPMNIGWNGIFWVEKHDLEK